MELIDKAKLKKYKAFAERHLRDPVKLRLVTIFILFGLSIAVIYLPFSKKIEETQKILSLEKERNSLIKDFEKLQKQSASIQLLMGQKLDTNGWVQFLLDGLRKFQVKLRGLEATKQKKVGPYSAAAFSVEVEGPYPELKKYIEWLESSGGLVRIDSIQFEKTPKNVVMKTAILGIIKKK